MQHERSILCGIATVALALLPHTGLAIVRYVSVSSTTPTPPYTSWASAATTIQDAVDVATNGDLVLVNDGTYQTGGHSVPGLTDTTNRVAVPLPITIQSVNGPTVTTIRGRSGLSPARCVYLVNNAMLIGFTLRNGFTPNTGDYFNGQSGAGVLCQSTSAVLSNCLITACDASGGGGGAFSGTLINCTLTANDAGDEGGGSNSSILNNCTLTGNAAIWGGGAFYATLSNCVLVGNTASGTSLGQTVGDGGGAYQGTLVNCVLSNNSSAINGGGAAWGALVGCLVVGNRSLQGGGVAAASLVNCTVVGNSGSTYGAGTSGDTVLNSIIVNNNGPDDYGSTISNSCTTAQPGINGNITNSPSFVNPGAGNYQLQSNSPCINAANNLYVASSTDLAGNPRIAGGTVDIGAYEFPTPSSVISYAWLQQYNLPTDGSADYTDLDGDGMNNWQEWMTGTDPTNSASSFHITSIVRTNSDLLITWMTGNGLPTALQYRSGSGYNTNSFTDIFVVTNMTGTVTNYLDSGAATNVLPRFYRAHLAP
jgi:hypothetical protein